MLSRCWHATPRHSATSTRVADGQRTRQADRRRARGARARARAGERGREFFFSILRPLSNSVSDGLLPVAPGTSSRPARPPAAAPHRHARALGQLARRGERLGSLCVPGAFRRAFAIPRFWEQPPTHASAPTRAHAAQTSPPHCSRTAWALGWRRRAFGRRAARRTPSHCASRPRAQGKLAANVWLLSAIACLTEYPDAIPLLFCNRSVGASCCSPRSPAPTRRRRPAGDE